MRRTLFTLAASVLFAAGSGCMAVSATDNSGGVSDRQQVVAVNNRAYLIDVKTGEIREIDLKNAKPAKVYSVQKDDLNDD